MGSHQNSSSFCSFPSSSSHQHPFIANSATQHFDFDDNQQLQLQQHHQQQQQQQLSNTNSPTFVLLDNPTDTVAHLLDEQCFWNAEEHTNLGGGDVDFDWTSLAWTPLARSSSNRALLISTSLRSSVSPARP